MSWVCIYVLVVLVTESRLLFSKLNTTVDQAANCSEVRQLKKLTLHKKSKSQV